ncbi:MlaD family protein [Nocardia sp. NPDC050712]|uniref:MlaD family protein n=1 Tax=Nocardia sp. NPDC050712 TaxID=3155518 RepID=UPI0033EF1A54
MIGKLIARIDARLGALGVPGLRRLGAAIPSYSQNRHWWLGLAAGAVVVALLVGSSLLSRAGIGQHTVQAEFAQAAGLRPGNSVDMAGIEVGTVKSARVERDHIVVALSLRSDITLGPDSTAAIKMSTILGKMHVELTAGSGSGLAGARIPLSRTTVPYNLAKVVNDPKYTNSFERLERLDPAKIRAALQAVDRQMGDSPQLTAAALDSVGVLAGVIADRRDEVDALLKNMDAVAQLVADNKNSVLLLLTHGQAIGAAVARRQDLVRGLLDVIAAVSKVLQEIGIEDGGRLAPLIQNLNTMSDGLTKNRDNLDRLYEIMPVALRQFNNTLGNGPYGEVYAPWLFPDNWLCSAQVIGGCR